MPSRSGSGVRGERGASRLGCLLTLTLLGLAAYGAVIVLGSEFDYRSLETEMRRQATLAAESSDDEIRDAVVAQVHRRGLPSTAEVVSIRRLPGNRIRLSLRYQDTLIFLDRWTWVRPRRLQVLESY